MKVYYLGFYTTTDELKKRNVYLSAVNKMTYIIDSICSSHIETEIVSCSWSTLATSAPYTRNEIKQGVVLTQPFSFGNSNKFKRIFNRILINLQVAMFMASHVKKDDVILAYHSPFYCTMLKTLKKHRKCHLVLELEELYADVSQDYKLRNKEKDICRYADAFIFPAQLLDETINIEHKPSCIVHGTYHVEADRHCKYSDGKIHVVYAGTFDPRKGGAAAAAAAAEFLDGRYQVHIIGFGSDEEKNNLLRLIKAVSKKTKCSITFDGLKSGDEYISFIQACDIGLSTQNPDAAFNATSFPSKILSYMANGLQVVSIRIPAIEKSFVGDCITYYDKQTPKEIAAAINSVNLNSTDPRQRIQELNYEFCKNLETMIQGLERK